MSYQEHDRPPTWEQAIWEDNKLVNGDAPVKWGGKVDPPVVGAEIIVTMNRCGPAIVTGYFTQDGWLGLKCKLLSPPEWHVKQNDGDPNGCVFGPEFRLPDAPTQERLFG